MKKILIYAAVVALMTACNNQTQTTEATETKKEEMKHELNLTQDNILRILHAYQTKMEQHIFSYFKIKGLLFLI